MKWDKSGKQNHALFSHSPHFVVNIAKVAKITYHRSRQNFSASFPVRVRVCESFMIASTMISGSYRRNVACIHAKVINEKWCAELYASIALPYCIAQHYENSIKTSSKEFICIVWHHEAPTHIFVRMNCVWLIFQCVEIVELISNFRTNSDWNAIRQD